MANNLKITSYNCKQFVSFGDKFKFTDELCLESDFLFLQELWLYKSDLSKLLSLGSSTDMIATSAMDESVHKVGRPFGGCAIVWRACGLWLVVLMVCQQNISSMLMIFYMYFYHCYLRLSLLMVIYHPTL